MKTLEIVVKDLNRMNEAATQYNVEVVSSKLISKCHLVVLKGSKDSLMNLNDEIFFSNRDLHVNYMKEILA